MIELENGARFLRQWAQDKRVVIDNFPPGTRVEFSNRYDCKDSALPVWAYVDGDHVVADVPNILLQTAGYLRVAVLPSADDSENGPEIKDIRVVQAEKPADYVYRETKTISYEELENRVEELEKNGGKGTVKSVNGVKPDESGNVKIHTIADECINLYVCSDGEYKADGSPVIANPDSETTYLVPQDSEGVRYASWVYANGAWKFAETLTVTLDETEGGNGLSAYEIAVKNGFEGTEQEWLESLPGPKGDTGPQGPKGEKGDTGYTPQKGTDYYTEVDKAEMVNAVIAALPVYNGEVSAV